MQASAIARSANGFGSMPREGALTYVAVIKTVRRWIVDYVSACRSVDIPGNDAITYD